MHLSFALPELSCKWIAAGTTNKPSPSRTTVSKASRATRPKLTGPLVESKYGRNRSQVLASLERPTRTIPTVSQEVPVWIREGWEWMLNRALGLPSQEPEWFRLPV